MSHAKKIKYFPTFSFFGKQKMTATRFPQLLQTLRRSWVVQIKLCCCVKSRHTRSLSSDTEKISPKQPTTWIDLLNSIHVNDATVRARELSQLARGREEERISARLISILLRHRERKRMWTNSLLLCYTIIISIGSTELRTFGAPHTELTSCTRKKWERKKIQQRCELWIHFNQIVCSSPA